SKYPKFKFNAGMYIREYSDYYIDDDINPIEYTSIRGVANNSAKIQSHAPMNYIYVTQKFLDILPTEIKSQFIALTDEEKKKFSDKIRGKYIYKVKYNDLFDEKKMDEIEEKLLDVKERIEKEVDSLNIGDISFESVTKKLSFKDLSLKGINKRLEGGVLCADIRGFTKLFHLDDQNLDDLSDVMDRVYFIMGTVTNDNGGTRVQYQGDRI